MRKKTESSSNQLLSTKLPSGTSLPSDMIVDNAIPFDFHLKTPFAHQLGGHHVSSTLPIIYASPYVYKPFQSSNRGYNEYQFYEYIKHSIVNPDCEEIKPFLPLYYGTQIYEQIQYLCLENLCENMAYPCIMDLKLGQRSYTRFATKEKIEYEKSKFPYQEEFGFRLQGIKLSTKPTVAQKRRKGNKGSIVDGQKREDSLLGIEYCEYDKMYGRQITNIKEPFKIYFQHANYEQLVEILQQLTILRKWMEKQRTFQFTASSILFVYDNGTIPEDMNGEMEIGKSKEKDGRYSRRRTGKTRNSKKLGKRAIVKLIDFAHVEYKKEKDENCLVGLYNIITTIRSLLNKS